MKAQYKASPTKALLYLSYFSVGLMVVIGRGWARPKGLADRIAVKDVRYKIKIKKKNDHNRNKTFECSY
jgi:hypothetical protein